MVNFDQLSGRVAITFDEDQRKRPEKARIGKTARRRLFSTLTINSRRTTKLPPAKTGNGPDVRRDIRTMSFAVAG
jgi:hypothetical protein